MTSSLMPRLADFPVITSETVLGAHRGGLQTVQASVAEEWLVHMFGSGEPAKVKGLPLSVVEPMYPESRGVVFFSPMRGTTMLDELQAVFDSLSKAEQLGGGQVLRELQRVRNGDRNNLYRIRGENQGKREHIGSPFLESSRELDGFYYDVMWCIQTVIYGVGPGPSKPVDSAWFQALNLSMFLCAPVTVAVEKRGEYLEDLPDWGPALSSMGLAELWVKALQRVEGWGRR